MRSSRLLILVVLAGLAAVIPGAAQGTREQSAASLLAQARRALTAGQAALALRTVEPLLARTPGDHDVVAIAIQATLALDDNSRAYALYDTFVQTTGTPAADLLKPIAVKELQTVAAAAEHDPRLRAEAFERLARNGDMGAAGSLRQEGGSGSGRLALLADTALSRLGDEGAMRRIAAAVSSPDNVAKTAEAEAVTRAGQASLAPLLVPLLKHWDPYTRTAAVHGLAALGYKDAIEPMRALLSDSYIEVRTKTALALARLGDSAGRDVVSAMLRSPVPDVRLIALEADPSIAGGQRSSIIRSVLTDRDPLNRVRAAEMLARDDPDEARAALIALTRNADSMPRREAARVLELLEPIDLDLSRRLMADTEPWVRMYGAGAVLKAAR